MNGFPDSFKEKKTALNAVDCAAVPCIDFVYLHGSARPSEKDRDQFFGYIDPMHDWISAALYDRPEVQQWLLGDGEKINPEPIKFYWGDMSGDEFSEVENLLSWSDENKSAPGKLSRTFRNYFILGIHDTVWVSEPHNKRTVTLNMHEVVKQSAAKGHQVVLLGHSAGAMAVQAYGMYHLPIIDLTEIARYMAAGSARDLLASSTENTCVRALLESDLLGRDLYGSLRLTMNSATSDDADRLDEFRSLYQTEKMAKLPNFTRHHCAPAGVVRGLVTYGHPGIVLEGSVTGKNKDLFLLFMRSVLQDNFFWINLNHANDPLGYSFYDDGNLASEIADLLGMPVTPGDGFFVSGTETAGASLITAHSWYWLKPHQFARSLAETFVEGIDKNFEDQDATK